MKKYLRYILLLSYPLWCYNARAQQSLYQSAIVAFYNVENLFDTINDPTKNDEEFLPNGPKAYTSAVYKDRINKIASVIAKIGININQDGPALLGVAEVENNRVLNDLVHSPLLRKQQYRFVHFNSKDARSIDVALIYNPSYFKVLAAKPIFVALPKGSKDEFYTRDILWVTGMLSGERVDIFVNHWPSRYGGEQRSRPARIQAAKTARRYIDGLFKNNKKAKIILMGDLNDNPTDNSVSQYLMAEGKQQQLTPKALFNPWLALYKRGLGTLAYHDAWSLFDQIILSQAWLPKKQKGFFFYKNKIFKQPIMISNYGRYKGYPLRTFRGDAYNGGYSDHFPTYIVFLKKIK